MPLRVYWGGEQDLLAVHSRIISSLEVEHGRLDPFLLPLARLPFAIKVPDGLCEGLCYIGVVLLQVVPHFVATDLRVQLAHIIVNAKISQE